MSDLELSRLRERVRELEARAEQTLELERILRSRERELNDSLEHATKGMLAVGQFARAEAERADRLRDEFLAALSHELRTPLSAILGWAQIVNGRNVDEGLIRRALTVIERNAALQMRHIDDLLDVARIITGKLQIATDPVDLTAVLSMSVQRVTPAAAAKNITLDVDVDATPTQVTGDADRLQQIVWHLLTNAVKFTPKGGEVHVSLVVRNGEDAELRVRDSGEGISAKFLPHVFALFRQADGSSTRSHRDIGLGLAVVRHLAGAHGGAIAVESDDPGCGATFTVTLPLQAALTPTAPAPRMLDAALGDGVGV